MTTDEREVLSALVDREPVDAGTLARVLEAPANRQLLIDFVRLRKALHEDDLVQAPPPPRQAVRLASRRGLLQSLVALVLVGLGLAGGAWYAGHSSDSPSPPLPSRVVQLTPVVSDR